MSLLRNSRGQSLIEYVILVALVGVATIGMVRILQGTVKVNFADIVHSLRGDKKHREAYEQMQDSDFSKYDFSDFTNGTGH